VLLLAIPLDGGRVLVAVSPPIVRIAGPPFLWAVQARLAIFRVSRDLLAVIFGAAAPLATRVAAHRLPRLVFRWLEDPLTDAASPFDHNTGCRIRQRVMLKAGDLETAIEYVLPLG